MPDREPPEFFLDRGLNAASIASRLREAGFRCVTMDEMYGEEDAKHVKDQKWIREATEAGLVLLHKDKAIRRRPIEKAALIEAEARSFAIANGNITGDQIVQWYMANLHRILRVVKRRERPYFYHVYADKIEPMNLT